VRLFLSFRGAVPLIVLSVALAPLGHAKSHKLYNGPERPASELVTLVVNGDSFVLNLKIRVNGKWVRAQSGAQILPGTYEVSVLSLCGHPAQYPPANPPIPHYAYWVYGDSFTAVAGDTVTYALLGENVPVFYDGVKKGQLIPARPGTTCYGAASAYHTVARGSVLEPDDVHNNGGVSSRAAKAVMKYLEAAGSSDQASADALLTTDFKGNMAGIFEQMRKSGWRFSASNTKILDEQVDPVSGNGVIAADVVFTSGPQSFKSFQQIFTVASESGGSKISRIVDWWGP
jgi:hypothetical protein